MLSQDDQYLSEVDGPQQQKETGITTKRPSGAAIRKRRRELKNLSHNSASFSLSGATSTPNLKSSNKTAADSSNGSKDMSGNKRKQQKTERAYSVVLTSFNVAIAHVDYPKTLMTEQLITAIKAFLLSEIDKLPSDANGPAIVQMMQRDGALNVACLNKETVIWLTNVIVSFLDARLQCVSVENLPRPPLFRLWIPDNSVSKVSVFHRLQVQNYGLETSDWRLIHNRKEGSGQLMLIQGSASTLNWMKNKVEKLYFGLGQKATLTKVNNSKEKRTEEEEETQVTVIEVESAPSNGD